MRYLYDTYKDSYPNYFTLQESGHYYNFKISKAFDFDYSSGSYWVFHDGPVYFKICFQLHSLVIESFEITTTTGACRPEKFAVEVSLDGNDYIENQQYTYAMVSAETKQFPYNFNKTDIKCYKFTSIQSACSGGPDIDQFEFF